MAIDTYATLQTSVIDWLKRADLTTIVPDLIMIGEKWIFRHARTRDMETALSVTIASGVATVPTNFVAIKHARIDGSPTRSLKVRPSRWILENYPLRSSSGKPSFIGVDGANFIFGPFADSGYSVLGIYYAKLTTIATSANALFAANPDLYLYAALCEAEPHIKNDKRLAMWMMKRDAILRDVNAETKEGQYDSAGMEVTLG